MKETASSKKRKMVRPRHLEELGQRGLVLEIIRTTSRITWKTEIKVKEEEEEKEGRGG